MKAKLIRLIKRPFRIFNKPYNLVKSKVDRSIRLKLILTFGFCFFAAIMVSIIINSWLEEPNYAYTNPTLDQSIVDNDAARIIQGIKNGQNQVNLQQPETFDNFWPGNVSYSQERVYVVAYDGAVVAKTPNAELNKIDIYQVLLSKAVDQHPEINLTPDGQNIDNYNGQNIDNYRGDYVSYRSVLPLQTNDFKGYVYVYGEAIPHPVYYQNNIVSAWLFSFLFGVVTFFLLFFYLTRKDLRYLEDISAGLKRIAAGDLNYVINKRSNDELGTLADNINSMSRQLQETLEGERKSEKTKNELITNVSHDLRTPLTSIIGYLGLLNEGKYENEEQAKSFIAIANRKALRLKSLIEALFEYTKLNCGDMGLKMAEVDITELIGQLIEENALLCEDYGVTVKQTGPSWKMLVSGDGDKLARVFDNLLTNAVKYGHDGKLIRVVLADEGDWVSVKVVNYGKSIPSADLLHLFERFYRVEKSRSEETGGTGLGLAITKQIIDLHGGMITAQSNEEETVFTVRLKKMR